MGSTVTRKKNELYDSKEKEAKIIYSAASE